MKKKEWEYEEIDNAIYENEANGHYKEWVDLEKNNLVNLFKKYLNVGCFNISTKIRVKAKKGIIIIQILKKEDVVEEMIPEEAKEYIIKRMIKERRGIITLEEKQ